MASTHYTTSIRRKSERGSANDLANREDGEDGTQNRIGNQDAESALRESGTQNRKLSQTLRGLA